MIHKVRTVTVISLKLALWLAVMLVAWHYISNPTFIDDMVAFSFGGQIPGSDTVIDPNTMIAMAAGASSITLLLIVLWIKVRRRQFRTFMQTHTMPEPAQLALDLEVSRTKTAKMGPSKLQRLEMFATSHVRAYAQVTGDALTHLGRFSYDTTRRMVDLLKQVTAQALRQGAALLHQGNTLRKKGGQQIAQTIGRGSLQHVSLVLHGLDKAIELQVRKLEVFIVRTLSEHDSLQLFVWMCQHHLAVLSDNIRLKKAQTTRRFVQSRSKA